MQAQWQRLLQSPGTDLAEGLVALTVTLRGTTTRLVPAAARICCVLVPAAAKAAGPRHVRAVPAASCHPVAPCLRAFGTGGGCEMAPLHPEQRAFAFLEVHGLAVCWTMHILLSAAVWGSVTVSGPWLLAGQSSMSPFSCPCPRSHPSCLRSTTLIFFCHPSKHRSSGSLGALPLAVNGSNCLLVLFNPAFAIFFPFVGFSLGQHAEFGAIHCSLQGRMAGCSAGGSVGHEAALSSAAAAGVEGADPTSLGLGW